MISTTQEQTPDRSARDLATGVLLIVATVLPGFLTASLATRIRDDFSFENSALGLCIAVFYLVSALSSNPGGRLLERIGPVRGMRLAAALTTAVVPGRGAGGAVGGDPDRRAGGGRRGQRARPGRP